ncbi:MAG: hypothetical protein IT581_08095 [Verrucomicrobiales bacterium]|nr:hypothetical protein [Verrucomicrobiales bacterium]
MNTTSQPRHSKHLSQPAAPTVTRRCGVVLAGLALASAAVVQGQEFVLETAAVVKGVNVNAVDVVGNTAYTVAGDYLTLIDVTDRHHPTIRSKVVMPGVGADIQVVGSHAFVAASSYGFQVFDVSNPANPIFVTRLDTVDANTVQVSGTRAYLADGGGGVRVVDVSNPIQPAPTGFLDLANHTAAGLTVSNQRAYVAYLTRGLGVLDVSNPSAPQWLGGYALPKSAQHVQVRPPFAYVAVDGLGLEVLNIADPARIELLGAAAGTDARRVELSGDHAYLADGVNGLRVIDIRDPRNLRQVASVPTERPLLDVRVANQAVYLSVGSAGMVILEQIVAPEITSNPQGVAVMEGSPVTFSVEATGSPTPAMQWQVSVNGGATWQDLGEDNVVKGSSTRELKIASVPAGWTGAQFRATARNKKGSVNSLPATLTVQPISPPNQPELGPVAMFAGFELRGEVGKHYRIDASTNPGGGEWNQVETVVLEKPAQLWIDRSSRAGAGKFYRAVTVE